MRATGFIGAVVAGLSLAAELQGQQVTVGTPFRTHGESFFENIGVNWGFNANGIAFQFGNPNLARPQVGGFQPNAGANVGAAWVGRNGNNAFFNLEAGAGSVRRNISQTPSVTLTNGYPGYVADTSLTPFVISLVPVVGGFPTVTGFQPMLPPPLPVDPLASAATPAQAARIQAWRQMAAEREAQQAARDLPDPPAVPPNAIVRPALPERLRGDPAAAQAAPAEPVAVAAEPLPPNQPSAATLAVPSVADARRMHELERNAGQQELRALWAKAQAAEDDGKPNVARIYYEMVARRATGELRDQAQARLQALRPPKG